MSFISVVYLLFLTAATGIYYLLPAKCRAFWLLFAGYFFYFTWQPAFTLMLFCLTLISFLSAGKIFAVAADKRKKKQWLTASIALLLSPLIFFKYFNFLSGNLNELFGLLSFDNSIQLQPYIVPLGISFFTFQAVSYVVDVYRGYLKPEPKFENYAVYMAFFPTLLAGPIERAKSMLGQIGNPVSFDYQNVRAGLQLILWGVFKKVVLADRMGDFMNKVYAEPQNFQGIFIYFALAFAVFQLFCDFSAYSDIAVGSARVLGIKLSKNFDDRVYAAPSREIFWRGWHRSLTSWLRDYIFFPLSRGVKKRSRMYFNLILVYLLVGLWHGAAWGFIIWGLLNGIWLVAENVTKDWRQKFFERLSIDTNGRAFYFFAWFIGFHVASLFGVFFRTESPNQAFAFIGNIINSNIGWLGRWETKSCAITIVLLVLMDLINRQIPLNENFDAFIGKQKTWIRWAIYIVLTQMILRYLFIFDEAQFMYFNF